jgi:dTDP-4-amino-4,6-dideoxygalactose transaminase
MVKEIGSDFPIKLHIFSKKRKNTPKNAILLASGRDSLTYILKAIKPKSYVLLPSYLCTSVLEPFKKLNIKYKFYKVDKNLNINLKDLGGKIKKSSAVLIINYFGFIQPEVSKIKELCDKNKIILIEDQVQSFLTKSFFYGDYVFNSYRKFLPLPDGSFLIKPKDKKTKVNFGRINYSQLRLRAGIAKSMGLSKDRYYSLFKDAEDRLGEHPWPTKMSNISKNVLSKLDLKKISRIRRRNYIFLEKNLKSKKINLLFKKIPDNVIPLGCPIVSKNRDKIRKELIKYKIYPPVHWQLPKELNKNEFKDSWDLSKRILTIPIDQRYNLEDMKRIIKILNKIV